MLVLRIKFTHNCFFLSKPEHLKGYNRVLFWKISEHCDFLVKNVFVFFSPKISKIVFQPKMFFILSAAECLKSKLPIMSYMFLNFFCIEFIWAWPLANLSSIVYFLKITEKQYDAIIY